MGYLIVRDSTKGSVPINSSDNSGCLLNSWLN